MNDAVYKPNLMDGDTGEIPIITDMHLAERYGERGEYKKALEHYEKAAAAGSGEACMRIAELYGGSKYLGRHPQEEERWLEKAITLGYSAAEAKLKTIKKSENLMKFAEDSRAKEAAAEAVAKEEKEKQEMFICHTAATEAIVKGQYESARELLEKIVRGPAKELVKFAAYDLFGLAGYADSINAKDAAAWLNLAAGLNHPAAVEQRNRVKKIAADIGIPEIYVIQKFIDDTRKGRS